MLAQAPAVAAPNVSFTLTEQRSVPAGAEIVSVSRDGNQVAVAGDTDVTVLGINKADRLEPGCVADMSVLGDNVTSVAFAREAILVALKNDPGAGILAGVSPASCATLWSLPIGIGPDSVVVSPDGMRAVIAIEDEENEVGTITTCPAGNVRPGRVEVAALTNGGATLPVVTQVPLNLAGIPGLNCISDPQPEGIAISADSQTAYVTLQENNGLATINLATASVVSIISMGTTTHLGDLTDGSTISISEMMTARRESDGASVLNGYLFTADEGDTDRTNGIWSGGRTMTVYDIRGATPVLLTDTGDQIERLVGNAGAWSSMENRSNNRGPEPEGVVAYTYRGQSLAAVTLERANGIAIFDVTNPAQPLALQFLPTSAGPEGITWVPNRSLLISANEVGRTLSVYRQNPTGRPVWQLNRGWNAYPAK
jgi:DNA-binding beta-propeller fold protein YncE